MPKNSMNPTNPKKKTPALLGAQLALVAVALTVGTVTLGYAGPPDLSNTIWEAECQKQPDSKLFVKSFLTFKEMNFTINGSTFKDAGCTSYEGEFARAGEYEIARPILDGAELDLNAREPETDPSYHLMRMAKAPDGNVLLEITVGSEDHPNRPKNFDGETVKYRRLK